MTPQRLLRSLALALPLLVLSHAVPHAALGQPAAPGPSELAPETRAGLAQAADDPRLAPWQRDLMLRLARTGTASTLGSSAADLRAALPALASNAADGAWNQLQPPTPAPARDLHSAIHDPVRNRMVVFAGESSGQINDVWALSLAGTPAWTQLMPAGTPPSGRCAHTAIYDPVRDRMVIFGGWSYPSGVFGDVWALSLAGTPAWTQLTPAGAPPSARERHSAIYDPLRDRMVVFGGYFSSSPYLLNDVWALSLAGTPSWLQLAPSGTPPSVRNSHSAIYDPLRDRMVVFGGYSNLGHINDVWTLSLAGTPAWTMLIPPAPTPGTRQNHSAIYDPGRDRMVVFGGYVPSSPHYLNDVWALSLSGTPSWAQLTPSGTLPASRTGHSAIYDPGRDRMVVFGGYSDSDLDDVWTLGWSTTAAVGDPDAQPLVSGLRPPAPNPTRGTTAVSYAIAQAGRVQLGVYDVNGRLVRQLVDDERRAGTGNVAWNGMTGSGAELKAGVYFIRLTAPGFRETRRVILLK